MGVYRLVGVCVYELRPEGSVVIIDDPIWRERKNTHTYTRSYVCMGDENEITADLLPAIIASMRTYTSTGRCDDKSYQY